MTTNRELLVVISALALPLSTLPSCGDSSSKADVTNGAAPDNDEESMRTDHRGDAGRKEKDAAKEPVKDAAHNTDDTGNGNGDAGAAGDEDDGKAEDAGNEGDAEVLDLDASRDAAKIDAQADGATAASEKDAAKDAAKDVEHPGLLTVADRADCVDNGGNAVFKAADCDDDQRVYAIANTMNSAGANYCCFSTQVPTGEYCGGLTDIKCLEGDFCDISLYARGSGCGVHNARGTCRTILLDHECPEELKDETGCGCDHQMHSACEALRYAIPTEIGVKCE